MIHILKTTTYPFALLWDGRKNYEVRVNDRDYNVGDTLMLLDGEEMSTERLVEASVISVLPPQYCGGLHAGYVILGLQVHEKFDHSKELPF